MNDNRKVLISGGTASLSNSYLQIFVRSVHEGQREQWILTPSNHVHNVMAFVYSERLEVSLVRDFVL